MVGLDRAHALIARDDERGAGGDGSGEYRIVIGIDEHHLRDRRCVHHAREPAVPEDELRRRVLNSWNYHPDTGFYMSRGSVFDTFFQLYSFGGMPVAGLITGASQTVEIGRAHV